MAGCLCHFCSICRICADWLYKIRKRSTGYCFGNTDDRIVYLADRKNYTEHTILPECTEDCRVILLLWGRRSSFWKAGEGAWKKYSQENHAADSKGLSEKPETGSWIGQSRNHSIKQTGRGSDIWDKNMPTLRSKEAYGEGKSLQVRFLRPDHLTRVGQRSGLRISTVYTLMKFGCNWQKSGHKSKCRKDPESTLQRKEDGNGIFREDVWKKRMRDLWRRDRSSWKP